MKTEPISLNPSASGHQYSTRRRGGSLKTKVILALVGLIAAGGAYLMVRHTDYVSMFVPVMILALIPILAMIMNHLLAGSEEHRHGIGIDSDLEEYEPVRPSDEQT